MYIAYNLSCLAIYLVPIPLTPPDDEVGIGVPNLCCHPQRATYIIILMKWPNLPF